MTGIRATFSSEWLKLWTVRSTWWSTGTAVVLMPVFAAVMGADFAGDVSEGEITDGVTSMAITEPAANAAMIAQFGLLAFAMMSVTAEFATGAIRSTFAADPARGRVLLAKTLAVAAAALPVALVMVVLGVVVGDAALGEYGRGGGVVSAVASFSGYLVLSAVFTVGVSALVRSAVATLSTVIVLLLALPMMFTTGVWNFLPGGAGYVLLGREDPPFSRITAAVVLAAWALAAQVVGVLAVRRRDA
ncbi:hypothetical protein [Embleya sp. NPDC005575]|uniref:hypothetical protein n=1 Tax=Embleya sp. NPDC005575 TaxID=3156892 RepID=UPI0033B7D8F1